MDPKALSHLDPKQKEAYERIMGHAAAADDASQVPPQAPIDAQPADHTSAPLDTTIGATDPNQPQFYTPGQDQAPTDSATNQFETNPPLSTDPSALSSEPTILSQEPSAAPFDASSVATDNTFSTEPPQDNLAPPNSSFFSNPSPAETPPPAAADALSEPFTASPEVATTSSPDSFASATPITPYTPGETPAATPGGESFAAPLPSPASVTQEQKKESSPLLRVLYIIGAVIFFAVYTIFWVKVFNLPFLF